MKKVSIVGVPEHFNHPWLMAIAENAFAERGIELVWTNVPEGTGKMCELLEQGIADLAIILTEGVTKSISEGNPVKIVQEYIASPLQWGIHVDAKSNYTRLTDLEHSKAAISRYGSGSHLMAYVNAQNQGWNTETLNFEVVNTLEGAITALTHGNADYFMWEHFTTKPWVTNGTFRRLDDCPSPWPCFVIAATQKFLDSDRSTLLHILEIINAYTREFKSIPSIDRTLANYYTQELDDIQKWLSITQWSQKNIESQTIVNVQNTLFNLKLINKVLDFDAMVFS